MRAAEICKFVETGSDGRLANTWIPATPSNILSPSRRRHLQKRTPWFQSGADEAAEEHGNM